MKIERCLRFKQSYSMSWMTASPVGKGTNILEIELHDCVMKIAHGSSKAVFSASQRSILI